jgi:hypothetical protein
MLTNKNKNLTATAKSNIDSIIGLTQEKEGSCKVELSFQYLAGQDKLEWLSVVSDQGVLMGLCLQEMVQEMMISKGKTDKAVSGALIWHNDNVERRTSWKNEFI